MAESSKLKVSVVVPCLNRAHYLVQTIESILAQDWPALECIVVDGGSTDGTVEILKGYGDRIKWITGHDDGHADAVNKGWVISSGDILAWLNADDLYIVPGAVRAAAAYLSEHSEVDVAYGDFMGIAEDGRLLSGIIQSPEWDLARAVKHCLPLVMQPASFIRRTALERAGWLDAAFLNGKDHELWLRIGLAGVIRHIPSPVAKVRRCPGLSQRPDLAGMKIELTKKFLGRTDLPAQFYEPRFRKRAMSNAFLMASIYSWTSRGGREETSRYLMSAVRTDPANLFAVTGVFLAHALFNTLPVGCRDTLRRLRGNVRRIVHSR